jgi:6-phosphogluconolactonase
MRSIQHPFAEILVYPEAKAFYRAVADEFLRLGRVSIAQQDRFTVALAGGSTPRASYTLLAEDERAGQAGLAWDKVEIFFGDERAVPPDHPDSNFRMAQEVLLSRVPLRPESVHRIQAEADPTEAAARYEEELSRVFKADRDQVPRFDLILLGMGPDGHTASLFPGSVALQETKRLISANWVEKFKSHRITFTFPLLNAAATALFAVSGADKAAMVQQVLRGDSAGPIYPAERVRPSTGRLVWMLDEAAASALS